ncbi:CPBP family intramembrane metalloprotease domain-containing protein [Paenibacillus sp. PK3_47]|uniref:CPBP family intramembrane glutamic endopeptidase n=1 Tax=Paenibacillus sp. PK3_47 TaxID=2072642 RepID=UPI00201E0414|nr:CPBP family intramembrane glutamic endopeptidase [Paenibacillus sp. PK3_47]UQZ33279.1 CPBP family intramembrane metalloprotease domain-containing protein [Paenibacillus sp. PK3_47]
MNSVGQPLQQRPLTTRLILMGILGLVVFVMFQVAPQLLAGTSGTNTKVISKAEAREQAAAFAARQLGHTETAEDKWTVSYRTDSAFYGYMSREKLLEDYTKRKLDQSYPFDVFHAVLHSPDGADALFAIDLNMYTGKVVAFAAGAHADSGEGLDYGEAPASALEGNRSGVLRSDGLTLVQKESLALPWLKLWGANPASLQIESNTDGYGLVYSDSSVKVGESPLRYNFNFQNGEVSYFQAGFSAPAWHVTYVEDQTSLAERLTLLGYGLPTLALGILALIYSILRRESTSFKRGIFLSSVHFLIMMVSTYNSLPESGDHSPEARVTAVVLFIIYTLYSLLMSSLLYFSLVGGDGLWRQEEGLNPWARAKEPGYGKFVLDSMRIGYVWAFILLGVQTVLFIILSLTLDNWSTTDAGQSPYNMRYAWLLPVVAWLAGLSEEAVYRLFGIRMLKKIVRSTFVASLITTVIWAFGHTLYPIYPISSRPLELTVIGLLFSYIFLRHGFIAVMFSHVVFDSILMGATLIFMQGTVNIGAGIVTIVLPFIVGYIVYRFNPPTKPDRPEPSAPAGNLM